MYFWLSVGLCTQICGMWATHSESWRRLDPTLTPKGSSGDKQSTSSAEVNRSEVNFSRVRNHLGVNILPNPSTDSSKDFCFLKLSLHPHKHSTAQRWSLSSVECQEALHYCWIVWRKTSGWLQKAGALWAKDKVSVVPAKWVSTAAWTAHY